MIRLMPCALMVLALTFAVGCGGSNTPTVVPPAADAAAADAANAAYDAELDATNAEK